MPKAIWQKNVAVRNAINCCVSEPKHATSAAASQARAHANCIFHFKMGLEAPLATASMVPTTEREMWLSSLPLNASDIISTNSKTPMTSQMDEIARTTPVRGRARDMRLERMPVMTPAATIVTGQANAAFHPKRLQGEAR